MHEKIIGRKHLFFDLDDTMTPSRSPIASHMRELLISLDADLIIVSGARYEQIKFQVGDVPVYALGQNGNHAVMPDGCELWNEVLTPTEIIEIKKHINDLSALGIDPHDPDDLVEERGAQVAFSIVGHRAPLERKRACDPDGSVRAGMLAVCPFNSDSIEVKIGGTTTFDYFKKGFHKGTNVARIIEHAAWDKNNCIYFGDQLRPGGNDEVVIGVIDTIPVKDSEHTYELLKKAFT